MVGKPVVGQMERLGFGGASNFVLSGLIVFAVSSRGRSNVMSTVTHHSLMCTYVSREFEETPSGFHATSSVSSCPFNLSR